LQPQYAPAAIERKLPEAAARGDRRIQRLDRVDDGAVHFEDDVALAEEAARRSALYVGGGNPRRGSGKPELVGYRRRQICDDQPGKGRLALEQGFLARGRLGGADQLDAGL